MSPRADLVPRPDRSLTIRAPLALDRNPAAVYLAGLSVGSRRTMAQALSRLASIASSNRLDADTFNWAALRYQHTAALRSALAERFAPTTANKMLAALRGVLKECWRLGYTNAEDYHRAADLKAVAGQRLLAGRMLTDGEVRSLFQSCAEHHDLGASLDAALLAVLLGCGLRRSEAAVLELADYAREDGELRVRGGKGNRHRIVPVVNGQQDALEAWLGRRGAQPGALFCPVDRIGRADIRHMTAQAIYMRLARRARLAGVKEFSPHDLRRTFISSLLDHGADVSAVQRLAGHANVATTTRYDRRDEKSKRKAAALLHLPYVGF